MRSPATVARAREEQALRLREQGLSYTQIASVMGYVDRGAARKSVMRALQAQMKMAGCKRRFGVEIETVGAGRHEIAAALSELLGIHVPILGYHGTRCECCGREYQGAERFTTWRVERDGSLRHAASYHALTAEVVSPILQGVAGYEEVMKVTEVLTRVGATTNRTTGLHVHVEASDLTGEEVARVVEFYTANQTAIDTMVSASRRNNRYANKYPAFRVASMKQAVAAQQGNKEALRGYANKYTVVNIAPLFTYGTIEFRQHQGSVNGKKITNWIKFVQAVVDAAQVAGDLDTAVEAEAMLNNLVSKKVLAEEAATYLKTRPVAIARGRG
jgi:hypothetical protein